MAKQVKVEISTEALADLINTSRDNALGELMLEVTKKLDPKTGATPDQLAYIEVLRIANSLRSK